MIEQDRKRRRGETASDDMTGKGVKVRQHREGDFRGIGKTGREAVEKKRANERAVEERERLSQGAPRERRDRFESQETRNSSTAEVGDVLRERESPVKGNSKEASSRKKEEGSARKRK